MPARTRLLACLAVSVSLLGGCTAIDAWLGRDASTIEDTSEPGAPAAATGEALDADAASNDPAADEPIANPGRPLMRKVQAALNERGLSAGPADGYSGPSTVRAIRLFKVARRMEVTDDVTPRLLEELEVTRP